MSEPAGPSDPWREPYRPDGAPAQPGSAGQEPAWQQPPAWQQHPGGYYAPWGAPMNPDPGTAWIQSQDVAAARSNATIALVVSCVSLFVLNIVAIPSIVLSAVALSRATTDPRSSRQLARVAWGLLAGFVALGVVAFILVAFLLVGVGT